MQATRSDLPLAFEAVTLMAGRTCAIDTLRLEIRPGAPVMVIGPNGAGKSSLLRLAMGLIPPTAGRITWSGRTAGTPDRRAIVFQRPTMLRRSAAANLDYVLATAGHCSRSASRASATGRHGVSRAASSSALRSPARWPASPNSCCSTSPRPASTLPPPAPSRPSSPMPHRPA